MTKITEQNKIDILFVTDNGIETVGGEQESIKIIINGVKDFYSIGIIQPGIVNKLVQGVHYYSLTQKTRVKHIIKNPFAFLKYIWQIKKIIDNARPEVIHTQAQVSFFIVALLKKFKLIQGNFHFIHTERGLYSVYSTFFKRMFHIFMKELDILITTTNFNMKYWKNSLNRKNIIKFYVIENTAGEIFEKFDEAQEVKNKEIVIGFAGRYSMQKDWSLALDICKKAKKQLGNNLKVIMAVGCLDNDATLKTRKMFEEMKNEFGSMFQGEININIDEMNQLYYELDIFIMTSRPNSESFGRTIVEAMSRRTVILTTDAGGPVEIINSKNNVCNTVEEFVEKILKYHEYDDLMEEEKTENLLKVKERYSLSNNLDKHLKLYDELL